MAHKQSRILICSHSRRACEECQLSSATTVAYLRAEEVNLVTGLENSQEGLKLQFASDQIKAERWEHMNTGNI